MPNGRRGGTECYWREWGEGAPEALLIHCTLAHSGAWKGLAPLLGRPAVAFDMPGHGRSGPWDRARDLHDQTTAMAEDFLTGDAPMNVIGHSFGATVALRLALQHPARVRRLVLIEPVYFVAAQGTEEFEAHAAMMAPFNAAIEDGRTVAAARAFTEKWGTGARWDDLRPDQRAALAEQITLVPAQAGAIFEDGPGLLAPRRLEGCAVPVLLAQGEHAWPVIDAVNAALAARLPHASRATIPGAGHMAPITHPEAAAEHIRAFFAPH
ncbi:Hydrolase, alpha/beta fold family [Candidatus Rhodobacter oscarellae]|uniref:Hydrolase, alpha/beta fold family n=1 Tax=Candidatus Rhodobacter oscarellae TaxID=1675527 RepID=A0A0J9GRI4_9RHOB|nr:alpha/beta hydrolase [Candidatus Rhodobacter lobularis]KMW56098.1 Hydrolase, alpha/beta fold family [Candidatus Rhodobacter lobularis]